METDDTKPDPSTAQSTPEDGPAGGKKDQLGIPILEQVVVPGASLQGNAPLRYRRATFKPREERSLRADRLVQELTPRIESLIKTIVAEKVAAAIQQAVTESAQDIRNKVLREINIALRSSQQPPDESK